MLAQEKIEQLKKELKLKEETHNMEKSISSELEGLAVTYDSSLVAFPEKLTIATIERSDAGVQTIDKVDKHCQTDTSDRKNFQCQSIVQKGSISTQTDSTNKHDFVIQATLQRATESNVFRTIKQEFFTENIRMPNIPNSVGHTQPKKRKLYSTQQRSSISRQHETTDSVSQTIPSFDQSHRTDVESNIDPSILNSDVYKIYRRCKDPDEAMKQIQGMRNCCWITKPSAPLPPENYLKSGFDDALRKLWSFGPSKWEQIKQYLDGDFDDEFDFMGYGGPKVKWDSKDRTREFSIVTILEKCFTKIKVLLPYGLEFWYVKNFEGGLGVSKWHRGASFALPKPEDNWIGHLEQYGAKMAKLHAIGLTDSMIKEHRTAYYLAKNSVKIPWLDFAKFLLKTNQYYLFPDHIRDNRESLSIRDKIKFDYSEVKNETTFEFNATLELRYYDNDEWRRTFKSYTGKSTRPLSKTRSPKNDKEEMVREAEQAALINCFKDRWGFTEFADVTVDELHRPITVNQC